MRRWLIVAGILLAGCTLTKTDRTPETLFVTATPLPGQELVFPSATPVMALPSASPTIPPRPTDTLLPPAATSPAPPLTAPVQTTSSPTISPSPADTLIPLLDTSAIPVQVAVSPTIPIPPRPTDTPIPVAAAPLGLPTVAPLDDGSGNPIPDTGLTAAGVRALPETLYYLSDRGGSVQVWRLRYGLDTPDQLTSDAAGLIAFDVASNGTLAEITTDGQLVSGGAPVALPAGSDGTLPQATALAWSPSGDWLAYTLHTPGAEQGPGGTHPVDGLWLCSAGGQTVQIKPNVYFDGSNTDAVRVYDGPIDWRPDGSEVLVGHQLAAGRAYSRINVTSGAATPVWNTATLLPDAYTTMRWSINNNALITSGAGRVLRVEPDTLGMQALIGIEAGLSPEGAQQFADGTLMFLSGFRLYLLPPGQTAPTPLTDVLAAQGRVDFIWDNTGQQTLLVVYPADTRLGTAYLRDASGVLHDLTPLTGSVGSPRWGPLFRPGDAARVQTTSGDKLNVRAQPGGQEILTQLANGTRVSILGGPRTAVDFRWWYIQTTDGLAGWAVESVIDDKGKLLRTLLPVE